MLYTKAYIYFSNGVFLEAQSFGAEGTSVGEIVFNTSLTGYEEIITDPSYAGQFICFSMPEIGIVGANSKDMESSSVFCSGVLVNHYNHSYSNFRSEESLSFFLQKHNTMGLSGLNTRKLVKMIREEGSMMMVASTTLKTPEELSNFLHDSPKIEEVNYIQEVSTQKSYIHTQGNFDFTTFDYSTPKTDRKIIVIDFGVKKSMLNELASAGFLVEVHPHTFSAKELLERYKNGDFEAIFLTNGPGDPKTLHKEVDELKTLVSSNIPIFAICLGHQLLSLAHGFETYKMKFGHHGGNHPVKNLLTNEVEITSQNHIYSVPEELKEVANITHRNLFDNTIEGVSYKKGLICSYQHHPEGGPGPLDSARVFRDFYNLLSNFTKEGSH